MPNHCFETFYWDEYPTADAKNTYVFESDAVVNNGPARTSDSIPATTSPRYSSMRFFFPSDQVRRTETVSSQSSAMRNNPVG